MVTIEITNESYRQYKTIFGDDKTLIGKFISKEITEKAATFKRLTEVRERVAQLAETLENLEHLKPGTILAKNKKGKLIRNGERPLYRYLVAMAAKRKYGFTQSDITKAIGIRHCNYTYGRTTIIDLYKNYSRWQSLVRRYGRVLHTTIIPYKLKPDEIRTNKNL